MKAPFYGWIITACAFGVLFLTYGVQYSFGVFVPVMLDDLGWQRAVLGGAFSLYSVVYMGFSLVSGRLTDSWGPRRVIGLGGTLLGVGLAASSQVSAVWQLYIWYGIVAALGMSTAYIPCNATVVGWFQRRRGLALGLASCGASCGILVVPIFASFVIGSSDWRIGFLVLGVGVLILVNIIARLMVRHPEELGLLPDGDEGPAPLKSDFRAIPTANPQPGWTLREATGTLSLWLFVLAFATALLPLTVPFVHLPAFGRDIGLSITEGALAVSVVGMFSLAGSITLGALSDRIGRKGAISLGFASQIIAFLMLLSAEDAIRLYIGAAAFGFSYGGIASLFPALVGDLFGRAHAGAIAGFIFAGAGVLGAWGPAIAGYLRDVHGDYGLAFTLGAVVAASALALFVVLPGPGVHNSR